MRQIDINFQTPPPVCDYMVGMIPVWAVKVLEPTPGVGNLVRSLEKENRFDITAAEDFFLLDEKSKYDCIIMNPPFSAKYAFGVPEGLDAPGMKLGYHMLTKCMDMTDNVIALMPWFTISDSDVRMRALKNYGIKSITALSRKTFQYARIQTCVIELDRGYSGKSRFHFFEF